MNEDLKRFETAARLGGNVCLDFTNTVEFRNSDQYRDFLPDYTALLAWCWQNGTVTDGEAEQLYALARQRPQEAADIFATALKLRETLYRLFLAITVHKPPALDDLAAFNLALHQALTPRRLAVNAGQVVWAWDDTTEDLTRPVWPVILAAAELLTSTAISQVRQCPNCGWLFLDTSRNHTRRWCSMEVCGSKTKSRRQYERKRAGQQNLPPK